MVHTAQYQTVGHCDIDAGQVGELHTAAKDRRIFTINTQGPK